MPTVKKPSFSVVPFDNANQPATCLAHLLHVGKDGSASPLELVDRAFELFEGITLECVYYYCCLYIIWLSDLLLSL